MFTAKDIRALDKRITYRTLNDWDSKGLIPCHRNNKEHGWRRFTFDETLKILIISDLMKLGLGIKEVKKFIKYQCMETPATSRLYFTALRVTLYIDAYKNKIRNYEGTSKEQPSEYEKVMG